MKRFEREMESPSVRLIHIRDSVFVLVNSIAMEGDSCELCAKAEQQLAQIAKSLQCAKVCIIVYLPLRKYSSPVLFILPWSIQAPE